MAVGLTLKAWRDPKTGRYYARASLPLPGGAVLFLSGAGQIMPAGSVVGADEGDEDDDAPEQTPDQERRRAARRVIAQAAAFARSPAGRALVPAPARAAVLTVDGLRRLRRRAQTDPRAAETLRRLDRDDEVIAGASRLQRLL